MKKLAAFVGLACAVAALSACSGDEPGGGPGAEPVAGAGGGPVAGAGGGPAAGAGGGPGGVLGDVVLAMRPVESGPLPYNIAQIEGAPEAPRVVIESTLDLAMGEGYPSRFLATPPSDPWAACGQMKGELALRELEAEPGAIEAALDPSGALSFEVREAGVLAVVARGELTVTAAPACPVPTGVALPLEVRLSVRAARPAGTRFEVPFRCSDAAVPRVATSASEGSPGPFGLKVMLLDEAGQVLYAVNAAQDAPVTIEARGAFGATPSGRPPQSLAELVYPATSGRVELVPELGAPLAIEVVDASQITRADIQFQLAGFASGPRILEAGQVYGESGWARTGNRVAPMVQSVYVGDDQLCSPPSYAWFELSSLTPDVCEIVPLESEDMGSFTLIGDPTGRAARLLRDGACSLALSAPGAPAGGRLGGSFEATFRNVRELFEPAGL